MEQRIVNQAFEYYFETDFFKSVSDAGTTIRALGVFMMLWACSTMALLSARLFELYQVRNTTRQSSSMALRASIAMMIGSALFLVRGVEHVFSGTQEATDWVPAIFQLELDENRPPPHPSVFCESRNNTPGTFDCSTILIGRQADQGSCQLLQMTGYFTYWLAIIATNSVLALRARWTQGPSFVNPPKLIIIARQLLTGYLIASLFLVLIVWVESYVEVFPGGMCATVYSSRVLLQCLFLAQIVVNIGFLFLFLFPVFRILQQTRNKVHRRLKTVIIKNFCLTLLSICSTGGFIWYSTFLSKDLASGSSQIYEAVPADILAGNYTALQHFFERLDADWNPQRERVQFRLFPTIDLLINYFVAGTITSTWMPRALRRPTRHHKQNAEVVPEKVVVSTRT